MGTLLGSSRTVAATVCVILAAGASAAHAAKAVVTNCSNDTDLRTKLAQLQTKKSSKLKFNCGNNPTIILSGGPLTISKKVKIDGGAGFVTLSGGNANTILNVAATGKATLRRMILTRGLNSFGDGGAVTNLGRLTIDQCVFDANQSAASGGAILSLGPLNISLSNFTNNKGANGAAIYPRFPAAITSIVGATFRDNQTTSTTDGWGGAILIWDGASVSVSDTTFDNNTALKAGGAIYVFGTNSTLNSLRTTWHSNDVSHSVGKGGAVYNQGTFNALGEDLFEFNGAFNGGAIYNETNATLGVTTSTFDDNTADNSGGGVYNTGSANLLHTTFSRNHSNTPTGNGGGVYNEGSVLLENATLSGNYANVGGGFINNGSTAFLQLAHATITANSATTGGGISCVQGTVQAVNSIIGDNTAGGDCTKPAGAPGVITSQGFNLSSDGTCNFVKLTDLPNGEPLLGELENNGGFTKTHMPDGDSDAVDGASAAGCLDDDQRFTDRPQGAACDIGAVERCKAGKPGPFELLTPANGGTLDILEPFDWSDASCASQYLFSLRRGSSTGDALVTDGPVFASDLRLILAAVDPGTYAWRVKACNGDKCRPSPWWTFVPVTLQLTIPPS